MRLPYLKQLDGVRAIAALMVMFLHFFNGLGGNQSLLGILGHYAVIGQTGVSLFFVLSGFLITRILLVTKEGPHYFSDFYIRRVLRIFPLYYLFLIIYYFFVPLLVHSSSVPFSGQVYYWVYLQNFAETFKWHAVGPPHFWSLAVEEHFYLLWPCLVFFLSKKGIKIAVVVILFLAVGCRLELLREGREVYYFTLTRMDDLAIGALLAVWETEGRLKGSAKKFAIGLVLTVIPTILLWKVVTGKSIGSMQVIKFNLVALCGFCLVGFAIAARETSFFYKLMSSRFFRFTGRISYGLYVYHPLCYPLIEYYFPTISVPARFLVSFGATYLIAGLSYYLFEAKFIALKKYFAYGRDRTTHFSTFGA
ncbi:MAG TPA: acyltransferase [Puia sp.]|jgi:peptidoglycan/LPS O-acetylase OafA/YrhL|nr:acyltransferase [Puia sp.]